MNKSDDPTAPKNQEIAHAPHHGRNVEGDVVADATESAGQNSAWDTTTDLEPETGGETGIPPVSHDEGYSSGPDVFVADNRSERE